MHYKSIYILKKNVCISIEYGKNIPSWLIKNSYIINTSAKG